MLEESISSSPKKNSGCIHKVRQHRKNKRRRLEETLQANTTNSSTSVREQDDEDHDGPLPTLDVMYWDENESAANCQPHNKTLREGQPRVYDADFDPFEEELLLVAADRRDCTQAQLSQRRTLLTTTQGFLKCENLPEPDEIETDLNLRLSPDVSQPLQPIMLTPKIPGPETQFGITESELLNFCKEAEENVAQHEDELNIDTAALDESVKTPPAKKSIVEQILEDFCSSPLSPEATECLDNYSGRRPEDATPVFLFKHKTLRNYSRPRRKILSCLNNDEQPIEKEEEVAATAAAAAAGADAAADAAAAVTAADAAAAAVTAADAAADASAAAAISLPLDEDDCLSNCSSGLSVQVDPTQVPAIGTTNLNCSQKICENLLSLSEYFTQISTENSTTPTTPPKTSPSRTSSEIYLSAEAEPEDFSVATTLTSLPLTPLATQLINEIFTLRQKYPISYSRRSSTASQDFCGFSPVASPSSCVELLEMENEMYECYSLVDSRMLHDDDAGIILGKLDVQDSREPSPIPSPYCDINLSDKKPVETKDELFSDDDWNDDCDFFVNFKTQDVLNGQAKTNIDHQMKSENSSQTDDQKSIVSGFQLPQSLGANSEAASDEQPPKLGGFQTASKRKIEISKEAQQRVAQMLEEFQETSLEASDVIKTPTRRYDFDDDKPTTSKAALAKGLPNADQKTRLQAEKIRLLKDLEKISLDIPETKTDVELERIPISEWAKPNESFPESKHAFVGFQTAARKEIRISEQAKEKAKSLLAETEDLPQEEQPQQFVGFRTASTKSIVISAAAKLRAANILNDLPELPMVPENNLNTTSPRNKMDCDDLVKSSERTKQMQSTTARLQSVATAAGVNNLLPDEFQDIELSEWLLSDAVPTTQLATELGKTVGKRKLPNDISDGDVDTDSQETPLQATKILCKSYTSDNLPVTPLQQCIKKSSLSDLGAHSSYRSAIINRRNLLSLSKRKKTKLSDDKCDPASQTPIKQQQLRHTPAVGQTGATPNLKEFFDSVPNTSTSTPVRPQMKPLTIRNESSHATAKSSAFDMENDFKQIKWENINDSLQGAKTLTNDSFDVFNNTSNNNNSSLNKLNPSPQQRIERLCVFGQPPAMSPISLDSSTKCRPSGLRRGRSKSKQSNI